MKSLSRRMPLHKARAPVIALGAMGRVSVAEALTMVALLEVKRVMTSRSCSAQHRCMSAKTTTLRAAGMRIIVTIVCFSVSLEATFIDAL